MPTARAYDTVVARARALCECDVAFEPSTNLMAAAPDADPEWLEDLIGDLDKTFAMKTPRVTDKNGRQRKPQLGIPETLTVTQLADILDSGAWPDSWILPGRFLW